MIEYLTKKRFKEICDENRIKIEYRDDMTEEELYQFIYEIFDELNKRVYAGVNDYKRQKKELIKEKLDKEEWKNHETGIHMD